jgi:hypothetical protein
VGVEVRKTHTTTRQHAGHEQDGHHDEDDDRRHLYTGEPELELAVGADRVEVGGG